MNFELPPNCKLQAHMQADHIDMEYQRNLLLHYLVSNKLDDDALKWIQVNFPEIFRGPDE